MNQHKEAFKQIMRGQFPIRMAQVIYGQGDGKRSVFIQGFDNIRERHPPFSARADSWIENDAVICFSPNRDTFCKEEGAYIHSTSVAIEIKTNFKDLVSDKKMEEYAGANEYTFLAVPKTLLLPAVMRLDRDEAYKPFIGLLNYETGDIVILPTVDKDFDRTRNAKLMSSCFLTYKRMPGADTVYQIRETLLLQGELLQFEEVEGRWINADYIREKRIPVTF